MLSPAYDQIKRLRSNGNCERAIAMLRENPPATDDDAFEAAVCLFICGDIDSCVNVCRTRAWKKKWAVRMAAAFAGMLVGDDAIGALSLAREAVADPSAPLDACAIYILLLQRNALMAEAKAYVDRHWQDPPTGETFLLTMLAEVALASDNWRQAYRFASAVLAADPDDFRALIALSLANYKDGNFHESLGNARRANALNPGSAPAILQIMRCRNKLGDHYAAVAAFDTLTDGSIVPGDLHTELGRAYAGLGMMVRAVDAFTAAMASQPSPVEAIRALASICAGEGTLEEMNALANTYPSQMRSDVDCLYWRGLERLRRGDIEGAKRRLSESLACSDSRGEGIADVPWPVPEFRIRHDYEQLDLLRRRGKLDSPGREALRVLRPYYERTGDPRTTFDPSGAEATTLQRALGTHYNIPDAPFTGHALGSNDYPGLEEKYFSERLVVIDDFLSPEALVSLRTFCEEATVWKSHNRHGYVGALVALGFSPMVLLKLADELRHAMPRVIGEHPLLQAWGYKYDQRMHGIDLHADFARVNVNFWITPDEACEDPESGGMVVYNLPVPRNWTFADYNSDSGRLAAYVKMHEPPALRVGYRANRCVLFDSSLIHVTDRMHFKPGYENRRVNVTLLYGKGLKLE